MLARGSMASYGLALLSVAVAIAVRISLDPLFGDRLPFSINYIAITLSAAYAGQGVRVVVERPRIIVSQASAPAADVAPAAALAE